jgi:hypothetical protein
MIVEINKPNKRVDASILKSESGIQLFQEDDKFFLEGNFTEEEMLAAFAAHNPPAPQEPTIEDKLASVGLNLNDLKTALGLA